MKFHNCHHTNKGEKPFQCSICEAKFTSKLSLIQHNAALHNGEKPFKCNNCQESFLKKHKLDEHIDFAHQNEIIIQ